MKNLAKAGFQFILVIILAGVMVHVQAQGHLVSLNTKAPKAVKSKTFVQPTMLAASFEGGADSWKKYVEANLIYPPLAKRNAVEGSVIASFQVNPAGEIEDVKILESPGFGCDEEVSRLLQSSAPWQPAIQGTHPVKSSMKIIVHFRLQ